MQAYENFDLLITKATDGYTARLIASPVGEATVTFALDFSEKELRTFFWVAGRDLRLARLKRREEEAPPLTPRSFGRRLYDAVFAGPVRTQLRRSLDAVGGRQQGLRIRLRLSDVPELADLPWEYLYATDDLDRALALGTGTPIVRYLDLAEPEAVIAMRPPLRILGIVSDPNDVLPLNVEQEWRQLHDALADLASRGLIVLERLSEPTLYALQRRLRRDPIHVIHFIGHGDFDEESGGLLLFEDQASASWPVSADELAMLLQNHRTLRLAFLNACQGAQGGRTNPFAGVAQKLVQQGLPSVLAMQFPVSDRSAITLAHEFYRALADGYPIDAATSEARRAVALENDREWGTPVLFTRSSDNRILELPSGDFRPTINHETWEPTTLLIPGGPFLMGSDCDDTDEQPQHEVNLPDFRIGKTPVTNAQYAKFLAANPAHPTPRKPDWFMRQPPAGKADHPVVGVSWHDAIVYCAWLSTVTERRYRLPTEAEWEKAARSTDGRRYPWGNEWSDGLANIASQDTAAVNEHVAGASADGCLDLLGNVQEWTNTIWGGDRDNADYVYPYDPTDGREATDAGPQQSDLYRVYRGGSYRSRAEHLRASARGISKPDSAIRWRGFRVVMAIGEER